MYLAIIKRGNYWIKDVYHGLGYDTLSIWNYPEIYVATEFDELCVSVKLDNAIRRGWEFGFVRHTRYGNTIPSARTGYHYLWAPGEAQEFCEQERSADLIWASEPIVLPYRRVSLCEASEQTVDLDSMDTSLIMTIDTLERIRTRAMNNPDKQFLASYWCDVFRYISTDDQIVCAVREEEH